LAHFQINITLTLPIFRYKYTIFCTKIQEGNQIMCCYDN